MNSRVILAAIILAAAPTAALAQAPNIALLAGGCAGCHGASGEGTQGIPGIMRTTSREAFTETMRAFRQNERPNTVMGRITRGYTETEIAALAAHFARPQ